MKQKLFNNVVKKEERSEGGYSYTYELIVNEGSQTANFGLSLYSVRISMTDTNGRRSQREANDIFADFEKAIDFFDRLVRNLATPIDLGYVVEDEVRS